MPSSYSEPNSDSLHNEEGQGDGEVRQQVRMCSSSP